MPMGEQLRETAVFESGILRLARDPELTGIVSVTAAKYGTDFAGLSIITGQRQVILASIGFEVVETAREASICQFTIQRVGEPLIIQDAAADSRFARLGAVAGAPRIRFYAGYPVVDRNGYALGALCVADRQPRRGPFDPTDLMIRAREVERLLR